MVNRSEKEESFGKRFIRSKTFLIIGILVLVSILFALVRIAKRKYEINQEIFELEAQISRIYEENRKLDKLLGYYSTDYYKEKMAREELGLQKEGEEAIALPNGIDKAGSYDVEIIEGKEKIESEKFWEKTNPYKWFRYFFKI